MEPDLNLETSLTKILIPVEPDPKFLSKLANRLNSVSTITVEDIHLSKNVFPIIYFWIGIALVSILILKIIKPSHFKKN